MDYYSAEFNIIPYSQDAADLLAAFLADIGFDSFEDVAGSGLRAFIPASRYEEESVKQTVDEFPMDVSINWKTDFIEHRDWNEEWEKKYFQPLLLGGGKCVVHSSFHKDFPAAEFDITIDPKMAFGTGHHSTTTLMADHLFANSVKGKKVLDMGTGTGILSIIAMMIGAREAIGIEIDRDAYENAVENSQLNHVNVNLICGDARALQDVNDVDIFLANINRNIILADLDRYVATLAQEGRMFLSGFYLEDVPLIENALALYGMKIVKVTHKEDNWASIEAALK